MKPQYPIRLKGEDGKYYPVKIYSFPQITMAVAAEYTTWLPVPTLFVWWRRSGNLRARWHRDTPFYNPAIHAVFQAAVTALKWDHGYLHDRKAYWGGPGDYRMVSE